MSLGAADASGGQVGAGVGRERLAPTFPARLGRFLTGHTRPLPLFGSYRSSEPLLPKAGSC